MKKLLVLAVVLVLLGSGCATISGGGFQTPLPPTLKIVSPSPDVPPQIAAYSGIWEGTWDIGLNVTIVIEQITMDEVIAIYSNGSLPNRGIREGWTFVIGHVQNDSIVLQLRAAKVTLKMSGKNVKAEYRTVSSVVYAILGRKN
ncbi:hypothetical protein KJ590_01620 [Patescibacteria group bacterium]|nr:hypothetical protein [Patescibacteria group bacterium]MBU4142680.1 hypothetical protein [Patescibacteria group bacterium]